MSELIVREAIDGDGPALGALLRSVTADQPAGTSEPAEQPSLETPATSFAERDGRLWVVMRDDEAVGALGVYRRASRAEFDLALIGLDKEARGLGLATALLAGAEAFTAASDGEALGIWVDERRTDAIEFLERHGFVREPGLKGRHDGSDAIELRFTRTIATQDATDGPVSPPPSEVPPAGAG